MEFCDTLYLFSFNKPHLAWLSNVGSILSISLIFAVMIPVVAGWGYVPVYGLILGIIVGYLSLSLVARRFCRVGVRGQDTPLFPMRLIDLVEGPSRLLLARAQQVLYFAAITAELGITRIFLTTVLSEPEYTAFIGVLMIGVMCAMYTALGGYVGVLRTDLFQALVIGTAIMLLVIEFWKDMQRVVVETQQPSYYIVTDGVLFLASLLTVFVFHFGMSDLWIRNWGATSSCFWNDVWLVCSFGVRRYGFRPGSADRVVARRKLSCVDTTWIIKKSSLNRKAANHH